MSTDSKMLNPYDLPEEVAGLAPKSPPSLQADSAEDIVRALAEADPLAFVARPNPPLNALWGQKYPVNLECVLCQGEIPDGHTHTCPWYRANRYVKKGAGR